MYLFDFVSWSSKQKYVFYPLHPIIKPNKQWGQVFMIWDQNVLPDAMDHSGTNFEHACPNLKHFGLWNYFYILL